MVNTKISVLIVFLFSIISVRTFSQENNIAYNFLNGLYSINDDTSKSYLNGDKVFVIITNKTCIGCYEQICEKYAQSKNNIIGIVTMNKDYLSLYPTHTKYLNEIKCLNDVLFYFTDKISDEEVRKICTSPSPQLIIKKGNTLTYYPYAETMKLLK